MLIITYDFILKELKSKRTISVLSIFALLGFLIPFIPFLVIKEINTNSLISFVFLAVVFGLPFGYFIGMRNIISTRRIYRDLRSQRFFISIDTIVDMRVARSGRSSEMDDSFCELCLQKFSKDTDSSVTVKRSVFDKLKLGDRCCLIFVASEKKPVLVFAGNDYSVDEQLRRYIKE